MCVMLPVLIHRCLAQSENHMKEDNIDKFSSKRQEHKL